MLGIILLIILLGFCIYLKYKIKITTKEIKILQKQNDRLFNGINLRGKILNEFLIKKNLTKEYMDHVLKRNRNN